MKKRDVVAGFFRATNLLRNEGYSNAAFLRSVADYLDETDKIIIATNGDPDVIFELSDSVQQRIRMIAAGICG